MKLSYEERERGRLITLSLAEISPEDAKYVLINGVEAMAQYNFSDGHKLRMALERRMRGGYVTGPKANEIRMKDLMMLDRAGKIALGARSIAEIAEDYDAAGQIDALLAVMEECNRRVVLSANNLIW